MLKGAFFYFPNFLSNNFKNVGGIKELCLLAHVLLIKHGSILFSMNIISFIWQVKICPREKYIYKQICIKLLCTVFYNTIKAGTVCHYVTNEILHFILLAPNPWHWDWLSTSTYSWNKPMVLIVFSLTLDFFHKHLRILSRTRVA